MVARCAGVGGLQAPASDRILAPIVTEQAPGGGPGAVVGVVASFQLWTVTNPVPRLPHPLRSQLPCPCIDGEASKSLSIVVPAFNEQDRLPATLDETLKWVSVGGWDGW